MAMKWLLIATHVPPSGTGGGIVRYTVEMARALDARTDVDVHVLTRPGSRAFFTGLLGRPDRVRTTGNRAPTALIDRFGLAAALRERWDVVHGCKHLLPRSTRGFRILTVHDMLVLDRPGDFTRAKRQLLPGPYLASIREADLLLCVSAATRQRLLCYAPEVAGNAPVIRHASSATLHEVAPDQVRQLAGREFGLVVGDMSLRKNVGFVLQLWPRVTAQRPEAILAIAGPEGWARKQEWASRRLAPRPGVAMLGHLPEAQLRWCYEAAAVVLCPSSQEGFGLPALEALEFGARVITSNDPALVEVTGDRALHLSTQDAPRWVDAIVATLGQHGDAPKPPEHRRTWGDVAAETVMAVNGRI